MLLFLENHIINSLYLFSLQAAYTIGGHSFSAAFIEYVILKMKPPSHRPQMVIPLTENLAGHLADSASYFDFLQLTNTNH